MAIAMHEEFPLELTQFLEHHIESVPQIEALLLLRQDSQRQWQAAELGKALYIPEDMAISLLADFVRRGFAILAPPPGARYSYQTRDSETDRLIGQLASAYHERRVAVISLIYSRPLHKVQTFADAFRFSKENPQ
jgi:hypothetical protein